MERSTATLIGFVVLRTLGLATPSVSNMVRLIWSVIPNTQGIIRANKQTVIWALGMIRALWPLLPNAPCVTLIFFIKCKNLARKINFRLQLTMSQCTHSAVIKLSTHCGKKCINSLRRNVSTCMSNRRVLLAAWGRSLTSSSITATLDPLANSALVGLRKRWRTGLLSPFNVSWRRIFIIWQNGLTNSRHKTGGELNEWPNLDLFVDWLTSVTAASRHRIAKS